MQYLDSGYVTPPGTLCAKLMSGNLLDTWQLGWRHGDVAASNYAFYKGIGAELGWSDPVFQKRMKERGWSKEENPVETGQLWIDQVWHGQSHYSWQEANISS